MEGQAVEDGSMASDALSYSNAEHPMSFLKGLSDLRDESVFCDVIIRVGDKTYPVHKCVLAIFSPYFRAMFASDLKESHDREVTLKDIEPVILESLLKFFYTGTIIITNNNVQSLMAASNLLHVLWVRDACAMFMAKYLDASNCLGMQYFAEAMNCESLQEAAKEFALTNLMDLSDHGEFLNLPLDKLVELVSSDALDVPREEDVFTVVIKWFNHRPEARKDDFHKILECVRLPLMSPHFLHDSVSKQEILWTSTECHHLIEEALLYQYWPDRHGNLQSTRTRPRRNIRLTDVIVCAGGRERVSTLDCLKAFDSVSSQWASLGDLPFAVYEHGVVGIEQTMYVVGGRYENGSISSRLWKFDALAESCEEMASMSCARRAHGVAVLDEFLYAVGGRWNTVPLYSVERYNMKTNRWEQIQDLLEAIGYATVLAYDGHLYVVGGYGNRDNIGRVQRFDPRTGDWTDMAPMPTPRSGTAGCVLDGKLYIIGGVKGLRRPMVLNKVECYDVHNNKWRACSSLRVMRYCPGVAVMGGHIYALGGLDNQREQLNSVERYTPATDQWEDVAEMAMPSPRHLAAYATLKVPKYLLPSGKR